MNNPNKTTELLDMFQHPVFCVKDGLVTDRNNSQVLCELNPGTPVVDLLPHSTEEYTAFTGGCLSITVVINHIDYIATVLRTNDGDLFHLQSLEESPELRIMSLAAQQLRNPLSEVMTAAETLFATQDIADRQQVGLINRGLSRLLREIGNMGAVSSYRAGRLYGKETKNIVSVINEIIEKAQALCNSTTQRLCYTPMTQQIYCPTDTEMLERAIYNLLSNAIKFSPADSIVNVRLTEGTDKLLLSVESQVTDADLTRGNLFMRYVRDASVEDGRYGLGLGIPITQCAAAAHNGALLMDYPAEDTVRFTMTLSTLSGRGPALSSPFPAFDYMGGLDHALVELSDILPSSAFE